MNEKNEWKHGVQHVISLDDLECVKRSIQVDNCISNDWEFYHERCVMVVGAVVEISEYDNIKPLI